jgi:hypothetical protein
MTPIVKERKNKCAQSIPIAKKPEKCVPMYVKVRIVIIVSILSKILFLREV